MSDAQADDQAGGADRRPGPSSPATVSEAALALLVFRLGSLWYAAAASSVTKVLPWTEPVPVPGAPAFVKGVINSNGQILAVFDLAALLSCGASRCGAGTEGGRCIVLQAGNNLLAVVVDQIFGLSEVAPSAMQDDPGEGAVAQTFTFSGQKVTVLNVPRLLSIALEAGQG